MKSLLNPLHIDKEELLSILKEHLRVSLKVTGDYEGSYLEVGLHWDRDEIASDSLCLDNLR